MEQKVLRKPYKWELARVQMQGYAFERSKDGLTGFRSAFIDESKGVLKLYFSRRMVQLSLQACVLTFDELEKPL